MTDARETQRLLAPVRQATGRLSAAAVVLLALLGTACAREPAPSPSAATAIAVASPEVPTGACRLLTIAEVAAAVGAPVDAGEVTGPLESMCSWGIRDGSDRSVRLQLVPREYWEDGARQPGGESLDGVGEKAFVGPWLDDQRAGALTPAGALFVMSPLRDASLALLRLAVPRANPGERQ